MPVFDSNFILSNNDGNPKKLPPVEREIALTTPVLLKRVERALRNHDKNLDKSHQLLGEVKGHLSLRRSIATHLGLDRHYHLLNGKKADLASHIATISHNITNSE